MDHVGTDCIGINCINKMGSRDLCDKKMSLHQAEEAGFTHQVTHGDYYQQLAPRENRDLLPIVYVKNMLKEVHWNSCVCP